MPGVRLLLADTLVPLWEATEWYAGAPQPPPFWAFAWPGSQTIGRYVLEHPSVVAGRRVLDYGSGSGLAAIAAMRAGARSVLSADIDPLAEYVERLNAALNGVAIETTLVDQVGLACNADVVLAGDVCYDRAESDRALPWLRDLAAAGIHVLLADPGRHYAPHDGLQLLDSCDVPVLFDLESTSHRTTRLWRLLPD
ncbi:MAG: methyltransferase [Chloroflexota bacterium]